MASRCANWCGENEEVAEGAMERYNKGEWEE
jgi:hypothetical protein